MWLVSGQHLTLRLMSDGQCIHRSMSCCWMNSLHSCAFWVSKGVSGLLSLREDAMNICMELSLSLCACCAAARNPCVRGICDPNLYWVNVLSGVLGICCVSRSWAGGNGNRCGLMIRLTLGLGLTCRYLFLSRSKGVVIFSVC